MRRPLEKAPRECLSLSSQTSFPSTLCTLRKYNDLDSRVGQPVAALRQTQGEQVRQAWGLDTGPRIGLVAGGVGGVACVELRLRGPTESRPIPQGLGVHRPTELLPTGLLRWPEWLGVMPLPWLALGGSELAQAAVGTPKGLTAPCSGSTSS